MDIDRIFYISDMNERSDENNSRFWECPVCHVTMFKTQRIFHSKRCASLPDIRQAIEKLSDRIFCLLDCMGADFSDSGLIGLPNLAHQIAQMHDRLDILEAMNNKQDISMAKQDITLADVNLLREAFERYETEKVSKWDTIISATPAQLTQWGNRIVDAILGIGKKRKEVTKATKILLCLVCQKRFNSMCACCGGKYCFNEPILNTDGIPNDYASIDHFLNLNQAGAYFIWIICKVCNQRLYAYANYKMESYPAFLTFQNRLKEIEAELAPAKLPGFDFIN